MNKVYLALGTNLGDKEKNLNLVEEKINIEIGKILKTSSIFYSKAEGFESEFDFLNKVVLIETQLDPFELLEKTQQIEKKMGRKEKSENKVYKDRVIDIDILYFNDLVINSEKLTIPHPEISERDFVKIPLSEIK
jgi:2-amino-4-hydroxy-6-hydroxymethyldihydropteridine diphosphokinase